MKKNIENKAKGGRARAEALAPEKRSEIAKKAAASRWEDVATATHGSPDNPLKIGDMEIPCYVLEDDRRVLVKNGLIKSLGMSGGGSGNTGLSNDRMVRFIESQSLKPFISKQLEDLIRNPVKFKVGQMIAHGYDATILADICDAVLAARAAGALQTQQSHIADQCELLVRGFARVGIIALVDEATGFQKDRQKDALSKILEAFIAKELQPYVKTFPAEYYEELFRLRGLNFPTDSVKRPPYFGTLTNDIVYKRLAPGVLDELKSVTPRSEVTGRHKGKMFQWLTSNKGYPSLKEHLVSVVTVMKLSENWQDFQRKINRIHPKYDITLPLPLEYELDEDNGVGL